MKSIINFFESFSKTISGLSILLLCLGYFDLWSYYIRFDISIVEYIGVSEIIFSSFENLLLNLLQLVGPVIAVRVLAQVVGEYYTKTNSERNWVLSKGGIKFLVINILAFVLLIFLIRVIPLSKIEIFQFLFLQLFLFLIASIFIIISISENKLDIERRKKDVITTTIISCVLILFLNEHLILLSKKYSNVINVKNQPKMILYIKDSTFINFEDSIGYIGKTNGYYFTYNKNSNTTNVYPVALIKSIAYRNVIVKSDTSNNQR